jgi:hypothetical protein
MTRDELLDELTTERQVNHWWRTNWVDPHRPEPMPPEAPPEAWEFEAEDPEVCARRRRAMAQDFGCKCHSCKTRPRKAA